MTESVNIICEQDGAAERKLKKSFCTELKKHKDIRAAYLVRVKYGKSKEEVVALCIYSRKVVKGSTIDKLGEVFGRWGGESGPDLDIMIIDDDQLIAIAEVAHPFYRAG